MPSTSSSQADVADQPKRPKFVVSDVDRHKNERIYARRDGLKTRLRGPMFSAEFWEDYRAWTAGNLKPAAGPRVKPAAIGTFKWLCESYFASAKYLGDDPRTRYVKRLRLEEISARPSADGKATFGDLPAAQIEARHIDKLLAGKIRAGTPHGANNDLKALRALFKWAHEAPGIRLRPNPCVDVATPKGPDTGGHKPWTEVERDMFRKKHAIGTKPRLALELILMTGVRISDLHKIGRPHLRTLPDGAEEIAFVVTKGSHRKRKVLTLPVLPAMRAILDASKDILGDLTFLTTQWSKPYSVKGLGNWFGRQAKMAGLPDGFTAHGVRKLAAATMAENGATAHQLMAVFGWAKMAQAEVYTAAADQARMARAGAQLLAPAEQAGDKTVPLSGMMAEGGTISPAKPLKTNSR